MTLRFLALIIAAAPAWGQQPKPNFPGVLPGNGLAQHDFLYADGAKTQDMYLLRKGKVVWALRAWGSPADLGPSTTIQLHDEPGAAEAVHFGDPLVCTPRDAVRSFYSSGIDALFVGNFFLTK